MLLSFIASGYPVVGSYGRLIYCIWTATSLGRKPKIGIPAIPFMGRLQAEHGVGDI
jgi:hypothetical protein